jgi:hypothetical protein
MQIVFLVKLFARKCPRVNVCTRLRIYLFSLMYEPNILQNAISQSFTWYSSKIVKVFSDTRSDHHLQRDQLCNM